MTAPAVHSGVCLTDVSKAYGRSDVLQGCTFEIAPGEFTALIGPSGCGKTTIINLVAGYESVDAGSIGIGGKTVSGTGWDRLVVFQETALFPWKNTIQNVMFGPLNRGKSRVDAEAEARELLAQFGLSGFESKYPSQLSGGMQRRVELARAMVNKPEIMLLDEPFRGLDAMTRELMQEYLLKVFERNPVTTLFVTTEIEEAIYLADRIVVLSSRPTVVKETITVDLPRPRKLEMLSTSRFGDIHGKIMESLLEEATKAFHLGAEATVEILRSGVERREARG
ncbi:MAG: ABC transporter ATP-binding protein [Burkholderiales bacterium]|nr:ABC transporter ATP-binding protein [Burkholderiales bacterium]OJX08354.1 MAG: hypothetical protein BGO72_03045 [Burkholderiales bacterium 70-64]